MFNWIKQIRNSLLRWAARKGYTTIARLLIKLGADVNATDILKETILYCATNNGHKEILELLLDKGAGAENIGDVLCNAAKSDHKEILRLFKDKMDPDSKRQALCFGSIKALELLLEEGVINEEDIKDHGAASLYQAAYFLNQQDNESKVNWFLEHGVDVNATDKNGETALHNFINCFIIDRSDPKIGIRSGEWFKKR